MGRATRFGAMFAVAVACGGALLHIDVKDTASTTVPKGTILEDLLVDLGFAGFANLDITASEELRNQGVEPGDISSARFQRFTIAVTSPQSGDLSFLEELAFYVEAPGLDRVLFASASEFGEGVREIDLDLEAVDLAEYVVSDAMTITTEASGLRPDEDTTLEATFVLDVGVTGQGACNALERELDKN